MEQQNIIKALFQLQDTKYQQFQAKLLPFIEGQRLAIWTHNKAIQKAIESYRITAEQKEYLRTLKVRK